MTTKNERYAIVKNGVVENVCLWNGEHYNPQTRKGWTPPEGVQMVKLADGQFCDIGEKFSPAPRTKKKK